MPKRTDIHKILIIGSGPIVIGQACEFDYSGTQACKALRQEGYEVVLVNSNPATIMTDPETADRTYIEPLTVESVSAIIRKEKPDALLPTVGGQTALNLAIALSDAGVLEEHGVEMIGAKRDAIKVAEDRLLFKQAMDEAGLLMPRGGFAKTWAEAESIVKDTDYPAIIRPSFTLGGTGGGVAFNPEEFEEIVRGGLAASPIHEVLIEESILGWKEFELEVMRDLADNVVIICSIENFDPMGVHTGDSITVAPAQTLTDREYQKLRDMAITIIRKVGVETGGSNIQFAVNPENGDIRIIEMNPRVSRSSALASKATGFPIAKIAAKLAVGYTLDEIPNDITKKTPASFEPTIDYVVTKIPKWNFEKFREAEDVLGTQMKSVGEVMAIGRTFKESLFKGLRSLEAVKPLRLEDVPHDELQRKLARPNSQRFSYITYALEHGWSIDEIYRLSRIDPWFLDQVQQVMEIQRQVEAVPAAIDGEVQSVPSASAQTTLGAPETCSHCDNEVPPPSQLCPHCGDGGRFWNLIEANKPDERAALERRYDKARRDGRRRNTDSVLDNFETAMADSRAVISRYCGEVLRLASSTRQLYSTFYQLVDAGTRLPEGGQWDSLRELADIVLFPGYKKEIRFGALALDNQGLPNYGDCSIVLRDIMISQRASVFEENSALFVERHNIRISRAPRLPKGYRAIWNERGRLAVAKLFNKIDSTTNRDKYSRILLVPGATSEDDDFIEVHIFGPITVLTMEQVVVIAPPSKHATITRVIKSKLKKHNVQVN